MDTKFQEETRYQRGKIPGRSHEWTTKPKRFKEYPESRQMPLPPWEAFIAQPFATLLIKRKSVRRYAPKPLTMQQLTYLLWTATGIQRNEGGYEFRTSPSAGALYPIETYLVVNNVEELKKGIYHYNIRSHLLEELRRGDFSQQITRAALDQTMCLEAAIILIWTARFNRALWKYQDRGLRYVYLEAGHIAQNVALAATSLTLGSCQIGAFYDDEVNRLVGLDGTEESAVYLSSVGHLPLNAGPKASA